MWAREWAQASVRCYEFLIFQRSCLHTHSSWQLQLWVAHFSLSFLLCCALMSHPLCGKFSFHSSTSRHNTKKQQHNLMCEMANVEKKMKDFFTLRPNWNCTTLSCDTTSAEWKCQLDVVGRGTSWTRPREITDEFSIERSDTQWYQSVDISYNYCCDMEVKLRASERVLIVLKLLELFTCAQHTQWELSMRWWSVCAPAWNVSMSIKSLIFDW